MTFDLLKETEDTDRRYSELVVQVRYAIRNAQKLALRTKYDIGKLILDYREKRAAESGVVDRTGWNGTLGAVMHRLSKDVGYSKSELYDCLRFAESYPDWDSFVRAEFRVAARDSSTVESLHSAKGEDLSWHQVKAFLSPKAAESLGAKSSETETQGGKQTITVTLELPQELWKSFEDIAFTTNDKPGRLIVLVIHKFVQDFLSRNTVASRS